MWFGDKGGKRAQRVFYSCPSEFLGNGITKLLATPSRAEDKQETLLACLRDRPCHISKTVEFKSEMRLHSPSWPSVTHAVILVDKGIVIYLLYSRAPSRGRKGPRAVDHRV